MYTVHKGPSRQRVETGRERKREQGDGGRGRERQPTLMKATGKVRGKLNRQTNTGKVKAELNNGGIILGYGYVCHLSAPK